MKLTGDGDSAALMDLDSACLVVTADLTCLATVDPGLLDVREGARLQQLARPEDRQRFVVGASLLRHVVSSVAGATADELEVDRMCSYCGAWHGKPRVPTTGLHVSVSHSGRFVQLACTRAAPVGIDIQAADVAVTPAMRDLLAEAGPVTATVAEFLIMWTRVEAVLKATGDGLRVPLGQVRVSAPNGPPRLESYRGHPLSCVMFDNHRPGGYAGAVAILCAGPVQLVRVSADRWLRPR